jgi:creatinine amidohydrolase
MNNPGYLPDLTWKEAAEAFAAGGVALLPVGATEAHGPHLPLQNDVYLSLELCARIRAALAADPGAAPAVVLAPIPFAVTEFASGFAGSVSLSPATAKGLLTDVLRGLGRHGVETVALVNSHLEPAHLSILADVAASFPERPRVLFVNHCKKPFALRLSSEFQSGDCHAGSYETSLLLASRFAPLVRTRTLPALKPVWLGLVKQMKRGVPTFEAMGAADAYFGEPSAASAEDGERLWAALVEMWLEAIRDSATG